MAAGNVTSLPGWAFTVTLSHEKSGCGWLDVDYSKIIQPLASAADATKNVYVADYVVLLKKLVGARTAFIKDPGAFSEVHKRVSWSTAKRLQERLPHGISTEEAFISTNRLERIFVETLLRNLVSDIPNAVSDAGAHGSPLVQVPLWLVQIRTGEWYRAGLQLQGKKLKLNIADIDYEGSRPQTGLAVFDELLTVTAGVERRAYKGTSRDYRSWVWDAPQSLCSIAPPSDEFVDAFKTQVSGAKAAWQHALKTLQARTQIRTFEPWTSTRVSELLTTVRASRKKLPKAQTAS